MTLAADTTDASSVVARTPGYLPYLDGLRGVAILLVLVFHTNGPFLKGGFIGVDVFFVLSGFLITSLLIKEWDRHGFIGLGHFYMRRALRLLPAVVLLLAVFLGVSWFVAEDFRKSALDAAIVLFYGANWARAMGRPMFALGHTWSLSIEEQFYLLWPLIFIVVMKVGLYRRVLAWGVLAAAVALAWVRIVLQRHGAPTERLYNGLDTHADPLLVGCSLAFFVSACGMDRLARSKWIGLAGYAGLAGLLVAAFTTRFDSRGMFLGGYLLIAIAAAALIAELLARPQSALGTALQWPALVKLGRISYGVYLWHFPIYKVLMAWHDRYQWHVRWPLYLFGGGTLAIVIAMLSYHFIEVPFLRLKKKFQ